MSSAIEQALEDWLTRAETARDGRIPAERVLAAELGVSRAELRKALARLEEEGRLLRQVGRGSFLQGRQPPPLAGAPAEPPAAAPENWTTSASPRDVMRARLALEPVLAGLAAEDATGEQIVALAAMAKDDGAPGHPDWDAADIRFHRAIAEASRNPVLVAAHGRLAEACELIEWGGLLDRLAAARRAAAVIAEHETILVAIARRDRHAAESALRHHLMVEASTLFGSGF